MAAAAVLIDAHNLGTPPRSINLFDYRRFEALSERASDFASGGGTKQGTPFPPSISRALNPALDAMRVGDNAAMALPASSSKMAASSDLA